MKDILSKYEGWEDVTHEVAPMSKVPDKYKGWEDVSQELYQGGNWTPEPTPQEPPSQKGMAALQGFGNAAAQGYLPQLQAITEPIMNTALEAIASTETGANLLGVPKDSPFETDDYTTRRDSYAKMQRDLANQETGAYALGALGGGLASGIATGGAVGKLPLLGKLGAMGLKGRIGQAAATGGLMAGIANPGETEGEISPLQPVDRLKNAGLGALFGGGLQLGAEGARALAVPAKRAAELVKPHLKQGWEKIVSAADDLGIKPTPGMLNNREGWVERMEDSLQNSPSMLGAHVRNQRQAVQSGMDKAGVEMLEGATNQTPFQIGDNFKQGLFQNIDDTSKPISQVFDDIAASTKHVPVTERSIKAITRNVEGDDLFQMAAGSAKAQAYLDKLQNVKNANQVKALATNLKADLDAAQGADKIILGAIHDRLKNLEKNSITRAAIAATKEGASKNEFAQLAAEDEGRAIAENLLSQLKGARKDWAGLHKKMQGLGISSKGGPSSFKARVDALPNQSIQDKFLNPQRLEVVKSLQKDFPEQFELLKSGKLKDILDASLYKGNLAAQRFVREVSKFDPEFQTALFGEQAKRIPKIQTLIDSLPKNFNPSGTNSASLFSAEGLKSNVLDIPRFLAYKAASSNGVRQGAGNALNKTAAGLEAAAQAPLQVGAVAGANVNPIKPFDQAPSPVRDMDGNLLKILGKNPQMIERIKNPKLREAVRKHLQSNPMSPEEKDPRQSFIEGN